MTTVPAPVGPIVAWRPAALDDVAALTELFNASKLADGLPDEVRSLEEIEHELVDPGVRIRYLTDDSREKIYDVEMTTADGKVRKIKKDPNNGWTFDDDRCRRSNRPSV